MSLCEDQASPRWRPLALWAVKILLALVFLAAGAAKLFGVAAMVEGFEHLGLGQWFRYFTGAVEVLAAILIVVPATSILGALLIICTMIGAILAHAVAMPGSPLPAVGLLILSLVVAYAERGRLQTLLGGRA
jgi:putative oxidoreductase